MKKYVSIICMLIMCFNMVGCDNNKDKKESEHYVYYLNQEGIRLESVGFEPEKTSGEELIGEYLDQLISPHKDGYKSPIPKSVKINKFVLTDGIVSIDFDKHYYELNSQSEVLCRAAIVMTVSQVPEVEYVAFTVEDAQCVFGGEALGAMKASDFVSDLGSGSNEVATEDFKLYFANMTGTKLKEYVLKDAKYGGKSKERFVIEKLIEGPKESGYIATLSQNIKLINVVTSNNICYVDFEESFETEIGKVSNELAIYSIVDTLSELTDVHKVQISIHGDSSVKYHDEISLSDPFIRNLDLIEKN